MMGVGDQDAGHLFAGLGGSIEIGGDPKAGSGLENQVLYHEAIPIDRLRDAGLKILRQG